MLAEGVRSARGALELRVIRIDVVAVSSNDSGEAEREKVGKVPFTVGGSTTLSSDVTVGEFEKVDGLVDKGGARVGEKDDIV